MNGEIMNYVMRCKKKVGTETFKTLHLADNETTLCGKELNEMWWIESNAGLSIEDVTCKKCIKSYNKSLEPTSKSSGSSV